ncbi:Plasmodium variant antigen protein Cir/Yir/Bir, putative [Plasmodium chabaudi chabaudi]|uniref:Plasmodium variant antigen protein Cir/Yir/Bir, putative n=1 Tax=Plasmodium chabaudi chabaudi TaxID=31271 RepID=A0A1D3L841_PLACU|nr:Plasmodium variant antigen protein Cir/Yir/Bir, putative [Plasmodium chabaudi chabaudi]
MSKEVCNAINAIDNFIVVKKEKSRVNITFNEILNHNCGFKSSLNKLECHDYNEMVSSAFILLLKFFNLVNDYNDDLKNDRLAEYAILWLSYKLNQNMQRGIKTLIDFYTKHIKNNTHYTNIINGVDVYKSYKEFIDKNNEFMNINIKDMSTFYDALKILCKLYTACNGNNKNCTKYLEEAKNFAEKYKELNGKFDSIEDSPYYKVLFTLSTDYNNFKKHCAEKYNGCNDIPTLPPIKTTHNSAQISDVTSSSSSIASKLIPVLLIFVAIPISLGVAYKYSLFGFDKLFQRQYIRNKLKKIKKKMELNI